MKIVSIKRLILPLVGSIVLLVSGCVKDKFDQPPLNIPHVNFASNITIAGLVAYSGGSPLMEITKDTIVKGIVTANDESGNIYKSVYIEDNTGGLQVSIDQVSMYIDYKVGQRLYIKCKGLYLGMYGGVIQLGYNNAGAIGRIPAAMIKDHIFPDSLPGPAPTPDLIDVTTDLTAKINKLVKVSGISFPDQGLPYSISTATTDRNIADGTGTPIVIGSNNFVLRTSNYASFRAALLPSGVGSIVGILGVYNGTYQLYIRDLNDVMNFTPDSSSTILNEPFTSTLGGFTQVSVTGAEVWHWATYGTSTYAAMSGYSGGANNANEDWLISPSLNLAGYSNVIMKFTSAMKFATAADSSLRFYISSNYTSGAPSTATWTQFNVANLPAGANWTFVPSGDIDLSATGVTGANVHVAFKYTSSTAVAGSWELTNIVIKGTH